MLRTSVPQALNELTESQRDRVLHYVREGLSLRSIERLTGHRRETISRYARREGLAVGVPRGGRAAGDAPAPERRGAR